jgi:hypothetical protein
MTKEVFVFVVCGSREHIDTLHISLKALKFFSKKDILVITDSKRNEVKVQHNNVINISTSKEFNHHQASIYLKTGIHQFLPKGKLYCYLDTDVIALDATCDQIFNQYLSPISFAPDHCKVRQFSASAVKCGCVERCADDRKAYTASVKKHDKNAGIESVKAKTYQRKVEQLYEDIQKSFLTKIFYTIRYYLSFPKFWLTKDLYFDKKKRLWATKNGEIIKYEINIRSIAKEANLKYTLWYNEWKNKKGEKIFQTDCDHLTKAIKNTFQIDVKEKDWQHWNGGVFLFNDDSDEFLAAWHKKSLQIFNESEWKTRDQGTLIATVWEFGLQDHPTLAKDWNFIADFHNNSLAVSEESDSISDDLFETVYQPKFVHIFHEWGNKNWSIWNWAMTKAKLNE